ncbi:putative nuclease HARBI1 [Musca domestica]|nr:putative nuclease HARBI1 [Musca domestica]
MRIRYLDARHAGSAHDSLIWNMSHAKQILRERYDGGDRNSWILGDAGYPLEPYLMTPYRSSQEGSAEAVFNNKHAKARNIIERTIGVLKNRFRCLLGARQLHYKREKATKIANVCSALHNICIAYGVNDLSEDVPVQLSNENVENEDENIQSIEASQIRDQIKSTFV